MVSGGRQGKTASVACVDSTCQGVRVDFTLDGYATSTHMGTCMLAVSLKAGRVSAGPRKLSGLLHQPFFSILLRTAFLQSACNWEQVRRSGPRTRREAARAVVSMMAEETRAAGIRLLLVLHRQFCHNLFVANAHSRRRQVAPGRPHKRLAMAMAMATATATKTIGTRGVRGRGARKKRKKRKKEKGWDQIRELS
ncbi:uncharacterized protein LY79DRAFT_127293 [Colletotrichum navitas]|uniref:Uncharacterized protein n=1 Tax=Colletotrichum navitas TaxID=681940 RepID=A0AAD8Q449_9PEZI|nr:uncharacterized protein LY79DRAFT_127293 [Colletotrichum navitas]KAK1594836.1 hypothetical protein LY79DRAFT_127293 [Colletotrichum navitas]